jgi:hypothetical protein
MPEPRVKDETVVFDPPFSDIPEAEVYGLSWQEMHTVTLMRFREAGQPWDKLKAWLDQHDVYPKRATEDVRIQKLDWFALSSLMRAAKVWVDQKRDEDHPPGAEGEFE